MLTPQEQIELTLLPAMRVPEPLARLFAWIEDMGYFIDRNDQRVGFLYPFEKLQAEWTETERYDLVMTANGADLAHHALWAGQVPVEHP